MDFVVQTIRLWTIAKRAAAQNPQLMLSDSSQKVRDECVQRMKVLDDLEADLDALAGRGDLPQPLVNYLASKADKGCYSCWLSSSMPNHSDCQRKIDRYFRAIDELLNFGRSHL